MRTYPQRVRDNILPLSVAGTLPEAFEEWSFTDQVIDHEEPIETCGLCDQEELRYHFEIRNAVTSNTLWVGSQCILKFGLSVFDSGQKLSPAAAKKKLDRLTQQMRLESCLRALRKLVQSEPNDILSHALEYYEKNKALTPKFAFVVFWRLQRNRIDYSPSFFKVELRRDKHREDLRTMPTDRVHLIWPALSASQRKIAGTLGHAPPGTA
jgi:hypothetical protein